MKREYHIYCRFRKRHSQYLGTVKSRSEWYAFKKARQLFNDYWVHDELEEFYVQTGQSPNLTQKGLMIRNCRKDGK
jgi:hypothetical protein